MKVVRSILHPWTLISIGRAQFDPEHAGTLDTFAFAGWDGKISKSQGAQPFQTRWAVGSKKSKNCFHWSTMRWTEQWCTYYPNDSDAPAVSISITWSARPDPAWLWIGWNPINCHMALYYNTSENVPLKMDKLLAAWEFPGNSLCAGIKTSLFSRKETPFHSEM